MIYTDMDIIDNLLKLLNSHIIGLKFYILWFIYVVFAIYVIRKGINQDYIPAKIVIILILIAKIFEELNE